MRRLLMFGLCFGVLTLGLGRPVEAAIIVTNLNDDLEPGSLRWAIQQAAPGDTITFDVSGTIALTSGELVIDKNLTIVGPGPNLLTVSGEGASRVFRIAWGVVADLQGLAVRKGNGVGGGINPGGGGILNQGTLTLRDVIVSDNQVPDFEGGGILSEGDLLIRRSAVLNNTANRGGGIVCRRALTVMESTIAGNSADAGNGGGIDVRYVNLTMIVGSTISNNSAGSLGGGLHVNGGSATIVNSTISGNVADHGGGVAAHSSTFQTMLINTTVADNSAREGGGISLYSGGRLIYLQNSIVVGNRPGNVDEASIESLRSLFHGDGTDDLFPLADNGGPTQTHMLRPDSRAINAAAPELPADTLDLDDDGDTTEELPVDQRGVGFPRVERPRLDIGAVEVTCNAFVLTRNAPLAPSVGVPYTETLEVSGGLAPYRIFPVSSLPDGLTLSESGVLSGTPTAAGTFTITVQISDAYKCPVYHSLTFTLTIADSSCGIVIGPATLKTPYLATLYYQPLSVTPSGQYAVTVSAGELPPGVYLFAIGRNWYLGGIPSAPGTYTFTLAATKQDSPCAPTRSYTVIVPATVLPQLTCVAKTGGKQYTAHFGYDNSTEAAVTIPVGADNYFTPGNQSRGQTTVFQPGKVTNAFSVTFTVNGNKSDLAIWFVKGPDGVKRPVNITTATFPCQ